jgi:hypothetical protein
MNRFFRSTPEQHEAIRARMDAASGYPSDEAETWFTPAAEAPQDSDGLVLIACIAPIAEEFEADGCEEIAKSTYLDLLPPPEVKPLRE